MHIDICSCLRPGSLQVADLCCIRCRPNPSLTPTISWTLFSFSFANRLLSCSHACRQLDIRLSRVSLFFVSPFRCSLDKVLGVTLKANAMHEAYQLFHDWHCPITASTLNDQRTDGTSWHGSQHLEHSICADSGQSWQLGILLPWLKVCFSIFLKVLSGHTGSVQSS